MVAAIIHDIGQISFGHDMEEACPVLYDHKEIIERLLNENEWDEEILHDSRDTIIEKNYSLKELINKEWPNIDIKRVLNIIKKQNLEKPIDGVACDIIDGPIDADKLDYLLRDSIGCGVPYGQGMDIVRFLQALSIDALIISPPNGRLALSYKAKGSAVIESVLLCRYQMFGAVYWHHTFRCIQAMFSHAAAVTFKGLEESRRKLRKSTVTKDMIRELLYNWIICRKSISSIKTQFEKLFRGKSIPEEFFEEPPQSFSGERVLEFVWKFSDNKIRKLLERLGRRELYKRIYEIKISDLGEDGDYSAMRNDLLPQKRPDLSKNIEERILNSIYTAMSSRGPNVTETDQKARERYKEIEEADFPHIVIDFTTRGISDERNFPSELSDPARKYMSARTSDKNKSKVFYVIKDLQTKKATLRIFAAPELHELIVRYLEPNQVESCISEVITKIGIRK